MVFHLVVQEEYLANRIRQLHEWDPGEEDPRPPLDGRLLRRAGRVKPLDQRPGCRSR